MIHIDSNKRVKLERAVRFFKGILFVPKCSGCGRTLPLSRLNDEEYLFCDKCLSKWEAAKLRRCPSCGQSYSECACATSYMHEAGCGVLMSLVPYSENDSDLSVVRRVLFRIKDIGDSELINYLSKQLCYRVFPIVYEIGNENMLVTYAPRTEKARRKKGHDQSELLAKGLSKHLGIKFARLIERKASPNVKMQKKLQAEQRRKNAEHSFAPSKSIQAARGKCIILIDDVATTGASLSACAKLLKDAGASSVLCLCIAKTLQNEAK